MRRYFLKFSGVFIFAMLATVAAMAQFDDIYFDPEADDLYVDAYEESGDTYVTEDYYYDDDDYDYYEDDGYYYASRIRRFRRPLTSFGFYDPFYFDPFYYDPFFSRGSLISFNFGSPWNRWNRFNRWNGYGYGYGGYDPFYYDPFFYGSRRGSYLSCYFGYASPYARSYGYGGYYGYRGGLYAPWGGYGYGTSTHVSQYTEGTVATMVMAITFTQ